MAWQGSFLSNLLLSTAQQKRQLAQFMIRFVYENLLKAQEISLEYRFSFMPLYKPLSLYLDTIHKESEGLELGHQVMAVLESWPSESLTGEISIGYIGVVDDIASRYLKLKRYSEANKAYAKALELLDSNVHLTKQRAATYGGKIYHQLGMVAEEQLQWSQAENCYRKALEIKSEFNDRQSQAFTYHQLGIVAGEQRLWHQAEDYYHKALVIQIEFNDRRSQANTYHQLGRSAEEQRLWQKAEEYYIKALEIYIESKDRYAQAGTYHQLSIVSEEMCLWNQAEFCCRAELDIYIEFNDLYAQAGTYHQLGMVAQAQHLWPQAESYYRKAMDIKMAFNDRHAQASTLHQLGRVAEMCGYREDALDMYIKAMVICVEFEDYPPIAISLRNLAHLHRMDPTLAVQERIAETLSVTPGKAIDLMRQSEANNNDV